MKRQTFASLPVFSHSFSKLGYFLGVSVLMLILFYLLTAAKFCSKQFCNALFFSSTDEIMHQDIIPLYAADIHDQLKKQFAYLSGKTMMFLYTDTTCVYR